MNLRIDDHGSPVIEEVWALFARALARLGPAPTLIEWDADLPPFDVLYAEASRAAKLLETRLASATAECVTIASEDQCLVWAICSRSFATGFSPAGIKRAMSRHSSMRLKNSARAPVYLYIETMFIIASRRRCSRPFRQSKWLAGPDFFNYLAYEYIAAHPPAEPRLREFARAFPNFISDFPPCRDHPYFADIARLELAWLDAYHAADAPPLEAEALGDVPADRVEALILRLHPSTTLLTSAFPVDEIWRRVKSESGLSGVDMSASSRVVVARPDTEVVVISQSSAEHAFLESIARKNALGDAAARELAEDPDFDLAQTIAAILNHGFVVAFDFANGG